MVSHCRLREVCDGGVHALTDFFTNCQVIFFDESKSMDKALGRNSIIGKIFIENNIQIEIDPTKSDSLVKFGCCISDSFGDTIIGARLQLFIAVLIKSS